MFTRTRKALTALALATAIVVPMASIASAATPSSCTLREYHITSVTPYRSERSVGQAGTVSELVGAALYVPAEPGMTAEWLGRKLGAHLSEMRKNAAMKDCPFDVKGVQMDIQPASAGFYVTLLAPDSERAEEVLRRARLLIG